MSSLPKRCGLPPKFGWAVLLSAAGWSIPVRADWKDEIGYTKLSQELGAATPKAAGLGVSQIEAPNGVNYAPVIGNTGQAIPGTFGLSGQTFTIKSGNTAESFHASDVARQFFGTGSEGGRSGVAYGVNSVHSWEANHWIDDGFLTPPTGAPRTETRVTQNHSWIQEHSAGAEAQFTDLLRRLDFAVQRDGFLCVGGVNNVDTTEVPVLWATGYNVISVGRTTGGHSHGFTRAEYDGAGRIKPEIVAPLDFTSFSTAVVSGTGTVLRGVATTASGRKPETLRAILLAGATKEEFPNWAKTASRPLDLVFGAGEVNIYHSYKILTAGEQPAGSATAVAPFGWDYNTVAAGGTVDYLLEVPTGWVGGELSAMLAWNRQITDDAPGPSFNPVPSVANLGLSLYRLPGTPGVSIDASDSPVDNLEHVWKKNLCAGTYRLRVTAADAATYALAWRLAISVPSVNIAQSISSDGQTLTLQFFGLESGTEYRVETSTDLQSWSTAHTFIAASTSAQWSTVFPNDVRRFYRLTWTCP